MSVIFLPFGEDFFFRNATRDFLYYDKLINYINENFKEIKLLYSTPSLYMKAVNKLNKKYTTKTDDFFPYADSKNSYWTGFYT